jgi:hypothetical protein
MYHVLEMEEKYLPKASLKKYEAAAEGSGVYDPRSGTGASGLTH